MVYLFLGQEEFLKKDALCKLKSKVSSAGSSGLNYEEFQADEDGADKIIDCARTLPFLSKFRLLVVNQVNRFNSRQKQKLASFIPSAPRSVVLVLSSDSLPPQDPVYKAVSKNGRVVNFVPLEGGRLYRWISDRFLRLGKRVQPDAVRTLADSAGNNLAQLDMATEALAAFTGKSDIVTSADVENLIGRNPEVTVFQLVDAIGSKEADSALRILEGLDKDTRAVSRAIGLMAWQLRRIWRAKKLMGRRMPPSRVAQTVGIPQYLKDSFLRQVNNFSTRDLERGFRALLKADKDIKSTGARPQRSLELLIIRLCGKT